MHTALKITLWIVAVLALLLTGFVLYLRNADLSRFEEPIEAALSDAIGHKVDIDGTFEFRLGKLSTLVADEIVITNADWKSNPGLLTVGHLAVTVDTWSLLGRPIVVDELVLDDARVSFQRDADGQANWSTDREPVKQESRAEFDHNRVRFREVHATDLALSYDTNERAQPLNLQLDEVTLLPDEAQVIAITLQGNINEVDLAASGSIGPWQNLIDGRNISTNITATLGRVNLAIDGSAADLVAAEDVVLNLSVQGPEIERVAETFGLPPFASGPFDVTGSISRIPDGRDFRIAGNLGEIQLATEGSTDHLLRPSNANVTFDFSGPSMRHTAEMFGIADAPEAPFHFASDLSLDATRIRFGQTRAEIGQNRFSGEGWFDIGGGIPDGDITIVASGPDISVIDPFIDLHGIPPDDFDIKGKVRKADASVQFEDVAARIGDVRLEAKGSLGNGDDSGEEIFFSLTGPDVSVLAAVAGLAGAPQKPFQASSYLRPDPAGMTFHEARITIGDNHVDLDGVIGTANQLNGTRISVHGYGPELHHISFLANTPYLPRGKYDYEFRLGIADDILSVENFVATVVGASATADSSVSLGDDGRNVEINIQAESENISDLELFDAVRELKGERLQIASAIRFRDDAFLIDQFSGQIGNLSVTAEGNVELAGATGHLKLEATAPDTSVLDKLLVNRKLPPGAIRLHGDVVRTNTDLKFSDTTLQLGDYSVSLDGSISNAPLANDSDLTFSTSGPDMQQIMSVFMIENFPDKPYRIDGKVNGTPTGFEFEEFVAEIGANTISVQLVGDLLDKPKLDGTISATYLNVANSIEHARANAAEQPRPAGALVMPDDPLPLAWLASVDADFDIRVDRLILDQLDVHDVDVVVAIQDGALKIDPISIGELNGLVSGYINLQPRSDAYNLDTSLKFENIHIGILETGGADRTSLPPLNGMINLRGSGRTAHELMANADGHITLSQGRGRTNSVLVSRLFSDLTSQILQTINPLHESDDFTTLECAFYEVTIDGGLATIDEFVVQSEDVTLAAKGSTDFADESLKLSVTAKPRKGIGISVGGIANSFINVRGTLKDPHLQLDVTGSVATGGIAVATGGLSLVAKGLWDRVSSEKSICENHVSPTAE